MKKALHLLGLAVLFAAHSTYAVQINIVYSTDESDGFSDEISGLVRRTALEFAVSRWAETLAGDVPISLQVSMVHLGGDGSSAILAQGGAVTIHRDFQGGLKDTWYPAALANTLSGQDLNGPESPEIAVDFNVDVDDPEILGSIDWYYGTDAQPGANVDFVTVALHEIGHGLGFAETVDLDLGSWRTPDDEPGIFDRMLDRVSIGKFAEIRDAERLAAVISPNLLWDGPAVNLFNGSRPPLFTPDPAQPGASVGHWDPAVTPGELMAPFNEGAVHDPGMLLPALIDMGWKLRVATPTPRAPLATPTLTPTPTPTDAPISDGTPLSRELLYVSDFDADDIAVVDPRLFRVISRIPVQEGPIGIAASADGRRVYASAFRTGTLSVISTRTQKIIATIPIGASANAVAVTSDDRHVAIADTFSNQVVIVDARSQEIESRIPAGLQPSALAVSPNENIVFVTDYGEPRIAVIDTAVGLRRGIIRMEHANLIGLALAGDTGNGFVAGLTDVMTLDTHALSSGDAAIQVQETNEAVLLKKDGSQVYVAGTRNEVGSVAIVDADTRTLLRRGTTGLSPEAMALSQDEKSLYVANSGSGSVSFIDLAAAATVTVQIGQTPMGIAVALVPQICDGDCNYDGQVTIDEIVRAVGMALREEPVSRCIAADINDDDVVTIDEILVSVRMATTGCS